MGEPQTTTAMPPICERMVNPVGKIMCAARSTWRQTVHSIFWPDRVGYYCDEHVMPDESHLVGETMPRGVMGGKKARL